MNQFLFYLKSLIQFSGKRLWVALSLVTLGALMEGIGLLALVPLFSILAGQTESGFGKSLTDALNTVGLTTPLLQALAISGGFIILIALRGVINWKRETFLNQLGLEFSDAWRMKVFRAASIAPWVSLLRQRRTDLEHALTQDIPRLSQGTHYVFRLGPQLATILIQLSIIALLSPKLLLLVLVLIGAGALIGIPLTKRAGLLGRKLTGTGRHVHLAVGEFLAGQKLARAANANGIFIEQMRAAMDRSRRWIVEFTSLQALMRGTFQTIAACFIALLLLIGYFGLAVDIPRLLVVIIIVTRIVGPLQAVIQGAQMVANMLAALEALRDTLDKLSSPKNPVSVSAQRPARQLDGQWRLDINTVSYHYTPQRTVLSNVTAYLSAGETVALEGASGTGKTTFIDILIGLITPHRGTVKVDGTVLNTPEDWAWWRAHIAYVPQNPFLFDATILDNLRLFAPEASQCDIEAALSLVGATDIVSALPSGVDSTVGDRGQMLSGGERQRLCLARAILQKPRLLILDEATSALDEQSEEEILSRLKTATEIDTILLVTHRTATHRYADRIMKLSEP